MKVSLLLTGHMRCWKHVWPHIKAQFIDKYDPDIFVSTWTDEGWWRPNSTRGFNEQSPLLDVDRFIELYHPVVMEVDDYKDHESYLNDIASKYKNYIHNPKNVVSMYYKMAKGIKLLEKSVHNYDLVIRMRPDLVVNHTLPDLDPNVFYTTHHPNYYGRGTGDTFQASSYENIKKYCETFHNLDKIYSLCDTLCPHVISKTAIELLGVNHVEVSSNFKLIHSPYGHFFDSDENRRSIIFDVGANDHGDARRFLIKNNIEVHAFEPVNEIYDWATKHVTDPRIIKNRLAVDIKDGHSLMNIAAWEKWFCSSLYDFTDDINNKWKGPYHHNIPNFYYTGKQQVTTTRLDTYCKKNNISHIDYLWVSACGNDLNVLKSLGEYAKVVEKGRVVAFADTSLYKSVNDIDSIFDWLQENNFKWHIEFDDDRFCNEAEIFFER